MSSGTYQWYGDTPDFKHFNDVSFQLETQPTVLIVESLFILGAILTFLHAINTSKLLVVVWISAIVSGTMNDIFFMVLPFVDNFWHAQMTIMLTPRLPLYIPCAYACFQYVGVVASLKLKGRSALQMSCAAGLASAIFYAAYDVVGVRFLWWTWHTTDATTLNRWFSVPMGSTLWVIVHVFCFSYLLHIFVFSRKHSFPVAFLAGTVSTGLLATPMMMALMTPFQLHQIRFDLKLFQRIMNHPETFVKKPEMMFKVITALPGKPDWISLVLGVVVFSLVLFNPFAELSTSTKYVSKLNSSNGWSKVLMLFIFVHFFTLSSVSLFGDPVNIVSTGAHQTIGDCDEKDYDLSGYERRRFLCADPAHKESKKYNTLFDICGDQEDINVDWFSVCGKKDAKSNPEVSLLILVAGLVIIGGMMFSEGEERVEVVEGKKKKKKSD